MTAPVNLTLIGKGKFYARNKTKGGGNRYLGPTSEYTHALGTEKKELPNRETAGGGSIAVLEYVTSYTGAIKGHSFNAKNLALLLNGGITEEAAASVSAEAHIAYTNCLVRFDHLPDMSATVTPVIAVSAARVDSTAYAKGDTILASAVVYQCTTAGTSDSSAPTFSTAVGTTTADGSTLVWTSRGAVTMVDGIDYQLGKAGIEILESASRFELGLPTTTAYSQSAAYYVQLLTESQDEYEVFLDGLNEMDNGNPFPILMHRVKFSPTSGLGFKSSDIGEWTLNFTALPDSSVSGTGLSKYGKIGMLA